MKIVDMLSNNNFPIDIETAKNIHNILMQKWSICSNQSLIGYNSQRAIELKSVIKLIDSTALSIFESLKDDDLSKRLWGGRVFESSSKEIKY
jgi:hypothetical protein